MRTDHASASARSASRTAYRASSRACLAEISAPMMRPLQMTSRDLVLMPGIKTTPEHVGKLSIASGSDPQFATACRGCGQLRCIFRGEAVALTFDTPGKAPVAWYHRASVTPAVSDRTGPPPG